MDTQQDSINAVKEILRRMPDDLKNVGIQYSAQLSAIYWGVGDWVNDVYVWVVAENISGTKKDTCAACATILSAGVGADTVYDWSRVAAFYKKERERNKFQVLPFSHLQYAMKFGDDYARVIADDLRAMDNHGGGVQSLRALKEIYEPHITEVQSYQQTVEVIPAKLTLAPDEEERAEEEILGHLRALEGLLEKAAAIDAEGAVWIARAITMIHKALKKIIRRPK